MVNLEDSKQAAEVIQASIQKLEGPLSFDKETVSSADSFPSLAAQKNKMEPIFNILKSATQYVLSIP